MTVQNTIEHLKEVATKEGIQFEEEALAVIAEKADGGMRDALSIFDQAASFCQGNITYQKVLEDLNVLDSENYFRIVDLSIENKVSDVMVLLNDVLNNGFDAGLLVQGLAKHVRNVLMAKDPQTLPLLEVSEQAKQRYQQQAQRADTRFLYKALQVMNQCDINYRQSSNKRLLVELTLIEIAQITQPADAPASGLRPRRLKSLFKQLIQQAQSKKAAPQVAATAPRNRTQSTKDTQAAQPAAAPQKPVLKASSLGLSWNNLKPQNRKMQILPGTPGVEEKKEVENDLFSQDDLALQWLSMCNRMPQKLSGIAARMKNLNPVIKEMPALEVVVPNEIVKDEMELIRGNIVSTLRKYLHNHAITLTIRVAERGEREKILTRKEQFMLMVEKNPAIGRLCELFDLALA